MAADRTKARTSMTVSLANDEWGCAASRCLSKARVVITGPDGAGWGACAEHIQAVKKLVKEDDHRGR